MLKKLAVLNLLSVITAIVVNFFAQTGRINGVTMGEMSDKYANLFTPADYAFSIWGLIYLALIVCSCFMIYQAFTDGKYTKFIRNSSGWFIVANLGTALWVIAFLYDFLGFSVVIMFLILAKLCKIILNNEMEIWDAPFPIIALYWWPICIFSGWISVAAIANVAAWLTEIGWDGAIFSEVQWTIIMIISATIINLLIVITRNMREFGLVGVWALVAIFIRHQGSQELIANVALGGAILIFLYISYHGFKNRKSNPMYKMIKSNS